MEDRLSSEIYDYVILGTGLTETILSGAFALAGKKVLHLDSVNRYGSLYTDFSLNDFKSFIEEKKESFEPFSEIASNKPIFPIQIEKAIDNFDKDMNPRLSRDFTLELIPKFLFSKSDAVDKMLLSGVNNYLEFKSLQGTFLYLNNEYHTIPLSKSEIFKNDLLSLIDKRKLVKTIEQCLCLYDNETNPDKNQNSTHVYEMNVNITKSELVQIQSLKDKCIIEYMKVKKMNHNLMSILLYGIGYCYWNVENNQTPLTTLQYAERLSKYLRSIHTYDDTPLLMPNYGASEFPQAFSRLCAVFLGIFVVNNYFTIDSLHFDENNSFQSIKLSLEEKQISGKYLIVGRDYEPFLKRELLKKSIEHSISIKSDYLKTMLLILKTTFISSLRGPSILIIPKGDEKYTNKDPIRIIYKNHNTNSCSPSYIALYISMLTNSENDSETSALLNSICENLNPILKRIENLENIKEIKINDEKAKPLPPKRPLFSLANADKIEEEKKKETEESGKVIEGKEEEKEILQNKKAEDENEKEKKETEKEEASVESEKKEASIEDATDADKGEAKEEEEKIPVIQNIEPEQKDEEEKQLNGFHVKYIALYNIFIRSSHNPITFQNIHISHDPSFELDIDHHFLEAQSIFQKCVPEMQFLQRPEQYPAEDVFDSFDEDDALIEEIGSKLFLQKESAEPKLEEKSEEPEEEKKEKEIEKVEVVESETK